MKILKTISIIAVLAGFITLGCASKYRPPAQNYEYTAPAKWDKFSGKDDSFGFVNDGYGSCIFVNSTCDRYQTTPLNVLTRNLFIGMNDRVVMQKDEATVNGLPAFHMLMMATLLDDKEEPVSRVKVSAYTFRVGECVYDVAYAATPDNFDNGLDDFHKFLDTFKASPAKEAK